MTGWKYIKKNISRENISDFERKSAFKFTDEVVDFIIDFNNGRPIKNQFNTLVSKGYVFEKLLSFNENDKENIFKTYDSLVNQIPKNMVALALDPFGNYICLDEKQNVFLWLHERKLVENTGKFLIEFIESLY